MHRLALIAATGFLALVLTACGESGNKQPTVGTGADQGNASAAQPAPSQEGKTENH